MKAKRYNKGKNRMELIPSRPLKLIGDVYTKGAHKYSVYQDKEGNKILGKDIPLEEVHNYELIESGADNWRLGQSWMECLGSVKRHLLSFEEGEDFDPDINTYHLANAAWGIIMLLEQYRTHPQLDDRHHNYLKRPKIGLDIDNVICDWTKAWGERYDITTRPTSWQFSYLNRSRFTNTPKEELEAFYKTLPVQNEPHRIPFEPCAYLTARSIDESVTKEWLENNGFPTAPVYTVPFGASKVEAAKKAGIEWFIDDSYDNFVELNKAGICCFLYDTPHNARYDVGYKRIKSFEDFKERFL